MTQSDLLAEAKAAIMDGNPDRLERLLQAGVDPAGEVDGVPLIETAIAVGSDYVRLLAQRMPAAFVAPVPVSLPEVAGLATPLPAELVALIVDHVWPWTVNEVEQQLFWSLVDREATRTVDQTALHLTLPLVTVARELATPPYYHEVILARWNELETERAVLLGDFGIGSDAPIVLDYRVTPARVLTLSWHPRAEGERVARAEWIEVAPSFSSFIAAIGLGADGPFRWSHAHTSDEFEREFLRGDAWIGVTKRRPDQSHSVRWRLGAEEGGIECADSNVARAEEWRLKRELTRRLISS